MRYNEQFNLKLYKYQNNAFILQATIDDYEEISFTNNMYEAGEFTITINYNIPNSLKFERGMFVQFGDSSYKFGEIITITDEIGEDGKGSQIRTITGFDARYILKRRVIKNMNSNGLWVMTGKGELVLRNLINDQCGNNAEAKRKLPIVNIIPTSENAIGKVYSVSEQFTNLYEICQTIATQSEIGWRMEFDGTSLNLVCYSGEDRSQTVRFDTDYESLSNGEFSDSSDAFSNVVYVGGKGQNDDRDIYEGETAIGGNSPSGLDRFECWDNQSSMNTESEYEAEALSMLNQYGQTISLSGDGLAKCPYIYEEQYFVGDKITVAFSGKSAVVQILSVTECWGHGSYDIAFSFGKPQPDLSNQLQLILNQIQKASNKENSTDSVRWYTIPTDTAMPKADVTYNTIGFVGTVNTGATFTLYLDNEKTGAKTYHIYFKQLGGTGKLTLTTGKAGASNLTLNAGTYVAIIYVDENGNVTNTASTPTATIEAGNTQPATSGGVSTQITNTISGLSVSSVGGSGKYIEAISETDGKISATVQNIADTVTANNMQSVSSNAVAQAMGWNTFSPKGQMGWTSANMAGSQWYQIGTFGSKAYGSYLKIILTNIYNQNAGQTKELTIMYNWLSWSLLEISHKNSDNFFTDVAIGYENPNNSRLAVFIKTGSIGVNGVFIKAEYVGNTEANFVYDIKAKNPSDYTNYSTKLLHNASGVYFNEAQL